MTFFKTINVSFEQIAFGKLRTRKVYVGIEDLAESILEGGLINPILVQNIEEALKTADEEDDIADLQQCQTDGYTYRLIAGGRRFSALNLLQKANDEFKTVRVSLLIRSYESMLFPMYENWENAHTKPLEYGELIEQEQFLHRYMVKKKGRKVTSSAKGHTMADTAKMLNVSRPKISQDLSNYELMISLGFKPSDIKSQKDLKSKAAEARKIIEGRNAKARMEAEQTSLNSYKKTILKAFHKGNCLDGLEKLNDESVDFFEIDPPYAIDLDNNQKTKQSDQYIEMSPELYIDTLYEINKQVLRVLKPTGWFICWHSPSWTEVTKQIFKGLRKNDLQKMIAQKQHAYKYVNNGLNVYEMPGYWLKPTGAANQPQHRLTARIDMFIYGNKNSQAILNKTGHFNVFEYNLVPSTQRIHRAQRPHALMAEVIDTFCKPGGHVCVPFGGSGQTILSAFRTFRTAIGWDLSNTYVDKFPLLVNAQITEISNVNQ